ncbi:MAG TPA: hypothetical protein VFZ53_15005, partial [Polyangiaceae bacterium]
MTSAARATVRTGFTVALAAASLVFPKLALPAALFVLLHALSLPKLEAVLKKRLVVAHIVAGVVAFAAVGRFLATDALAGIVRGGTSAAAQRAISRLREILFAEDGARKAGAWDPDGDGVGSALLLGELTGETPVRGGRWLSPPLLEGYPKLETTAAGPSIEIGGFWFRVCVPTGAETFSSASGRHFDDELAERRYVAYAWPSGRAPGLTRAYFIDEHERILSARAREGMRHGTEYPPP